MRERIVFCWSGGKDSALALHRTLRDERYEVAALLTTCNEELQRVSMHGVRIALLETQARAIGLPLYKVFVSQRSSNEEYVQKMGACLSELKMAHGISACAFGDIFLEDLRAWREQHLAQLGLRAVFPIWKVDTRELLHEFFSRRFESIICCVSDAWLDQSMVGRLLDQAFIDALPMQVDPCGENGEFHSFAFAGPIFRQPIGFTIGERIYRPIEDTRSASGSSAALAPSAPVTTAVPVTRAVPVTKGFWFCDLLPA